LSAGPAAPEAPLARGLLAGRTVLVTASAGSGIGFATARRCAEEGASVMLSDAHERRVGEAAAQLERLTGVRPPARRCDVTREEDVRALAEAAIAELGHVDVLVNNAGLGGYAQVAEMTDEQWSRVLDVTLTGTFRMTRALLPHMTARGRGAIVNNASVLGWRAQEGQAHYAAAKAGVMAFTRCVAMEVAAAGVRVNAVAPSLALHANLEKATPASLLEELRKKEAFGRSAELFEVANVIVFLASDYASYLTGEVISVSSQHP
jgi:3-oxoacyl-[acyl-carrier protein] reductase